MWDTISKNSAITRVMMKELDKCTLVCISTQPQPSNYYGCIPSETVNCFPRNGPMDVSKEVSLLKHYCRWRRLAGLSGMTAEETLNGTLISTRRWVTRKCVKYMKPSLTYNRRPWQYSAKCHPEEAHLIRWDDHQAQCHDSCIGS